MNQVKVSVIVPNYNHARFLRQRLDTILMQSFQDFELIILDDCSSDDSKAIIDTYADNTKVVKILINSANSGSPFRQWQKGLEYASGEWVWIAESDDYADKDFLTHMISAANRSAEVGLVYCDSVIVTNGVIASQTFAAIKNKNHKTTRWSTDHQNHGLNEIESYLLPYGTINNTSAVLFRRAILQRAHPFDLSLRFMGDKYAFIKTLSLSNSYYVAKPMNFYRDPFNSKHADMHIEYFAEQFLIFDWVLRNLLLNDDQVKSAVEENLRISLIRGWSSQRLHLFAKSFAVNPRLFMRCVFNNMVRPLKRVV